MKKAIKILTVLFAITAISMVSFFGIYIQKQNHMENIVKGYDLAMDLNGSRVISIQPEEHTDTIIKDAEGNVIEEELTDEEITEKGYTKEEVNENAEKLTPENFNQVKQIIEKRLKRMNVGDYQIALNEQTGKITIELEEDDNADTVASNITTQGVFQIADSETGEVLLSNQDIKQVNVLYSSETSGTNVYMELEFTSEGKAKLEEISNTYRTLEEESTEETTAEENTTTDESTTENATTEENTTENVTEDTTEDTAEDTTEDTTEETKQKEIVMKIDEETIMTTSFDEPVHTGKLQLSVGNASTDMDTVNGYAKTASTMATVLENGNLPLQYEISQNEFIFSEITNQEIQYVVYGIAGVIAIALLFLMIKYKLRGIMASLAFVGYAALYLLLIRYTNVMVSLEGIFGIVFVLLLNYVLLERMILRHKEKKDYITFTLKCVPIFICSIVFCFIQWIPIASMGMILFWGIVLMAVYHYAVTIPLVNMIGNKE